MQLPTYARPPVVEVALSVQFSGQPFRAPRLWSFGAALNATYPTVRSEPALPPMREDFEFVPSAPVVFEMLDQFPGTRYVFLSRDESRLVQIQADRLSHNWRRVDDVDGAYPSYETIAADFKPLLVEAVSVAGEDAQAAWAEVTYVNHIVTDPPEAAHQKPDSILSFLADIPRPGADDEFEDGQIQQRFRIREGDKIRGRLHLHGASAFRNADAMPIFVLTLTARVSVSKTSQDDMCRALDIGHERIVNGFTALTTDAMHKIWERQR